MSLPFPLDVMFLGLPYAIANAFGGPVELARQQVTGDPGAPLTPTQKSILAAVAIAGGSVVTGAALVADRLSHQRITITELTEEPKGSLEKVEDMIRRNKRGISKIATLSAIGALLGAGLISQARTTTTAGTPVQPLATGQWYTPPSSGGFYKAEP